MLLMVEALENRMRSCEEGISEGEMEDSVVTRGWNGMARIKIVVRAMHSDWVRVRS